MSDTDLSGLDSEELLQIAVLDSTAGRHDAAIVKLKRAVVLDPSNARAYYMLGAEHAEIGLTERAIAEMTQAVAIDPRLDTAHFQLGLLHYTLGDAQKAASSWLPLDALGDSHALFLFKDGLLKLAVNDLSAAEQQLERATKTGQGQTAPLKADIEKVLGNVRRHMSEQGGASTESDQYSTNLARRYGELDS